MNTDPIQGAVTMDNPFDIRENGIFFKNSNWGLQLVNPSTHLELSTLTAIKNCLNQAYQTGFSDGVQIGLKFKVGEQLNTNIDDKKNEEIDECLDFNNCEQCGENAWDGRICHSCGLKHI